MAEPSFHVDVRAGVTLVRIDAPPANALTPQLLRDGLAVLDELERASGAVVLTGTGKFFSGGADLRVVPTLGPDEAAQMARDINALFARWYTLARPVVGAINGHAIAGGLILALCTDYRVGGRSGQYGLTEVKVGIPYPSVAFAVVANELAPADARTLTLTARLTDAAGALQLRVFDELVDDDAVLSRAIDVAQELDAHPAKTYELTKKRLRDRALENNERRFGGANATDWAVSESRDAAARVLDNR
jgi:enoyl-CoA hydratase